MKYSMFIGRWQPWHNGHQWLIDQRLKEGKNVLICIRDMLPDENNPYTCEEVYDNLQVKFKGFIDEGLIKIMIIPDIESINYGRDVGYEIIEHIPPKDIGKISATNIRKENENQRIRQRLHRSR